MANNTDNRMWKYRCPKCRTNRYYWKASISGVHKKCGTTMELLRRGGDDAKHIVWGEYDTRRLQTQQTRVYIHNS